MARSLEAMAEILGQPSALGDKIYSMPAEGLLELYQSGVIDDQTLEALKIRPDDITAAALSGGDVEIAGAALAVRLMAIDKAKSDAVIAHLRFAPEAMTKAEAEAWRIDPARETEIAAIQAEMEAMEKAAEGSGDAMEPDARRAAWGTIVSDVTADLKRTGLYKDADARAQAQVVAARTVLRAEQRGMNPLDLWSEERATVLGPQDIAREGQVALGNMAPKTGAQMVGLNHSSFQLHQPVNDDVDLDQKITVFDVPVVATERGSHARAEAKKARFGVAPADLTHPAMPEGVHLSGRDWVHAVSSWNKSVHAAGVDSELAHLDAVRVLPELFNRSVLVETHENRKENEKDTIPVIHRFFSAMSHRENTYAVKMTVEQYANGKTALFIDGVARSNRLHDLHLAKKMPSQEGALETSKVGAVSSPNPRSLSLNSTANRRTEDTIILRDLLRGIKGNDGEAYIQGDSQSPRGSETSASNTVRPSDGEGNAESQGLREDADGEDVPFELWQSEDGAKQVSDAVKSIAKGADEVVIPNLRPDLVAYGGVADVSLLWGNNKKGLVHIGKKRGVDTVLSVIRAVSAGKITKFVTAKKTVHLELNGFEAVLSLDEDGNKKTWLLTGWEINRPDAGGEVGTQSAATQNTPTFSRDALGAGLERILARDGTFFQSSQNAPRGSYTPATNTIRLFQSANMSTFVHESGHQWLFQMADDLGDARLLPEARAQIVADLGAVLGHLGVKGVDPTTATPQQIKAALSVEQHETFARSVEAYLREGKAPSKELRSAFRRLSSWLVQIYRSLRGLNVEMTAEIRGVMDRLLANETALAAERQGREVTIAPGIWRAASEAERAKLGAALNEAKDEAFMKVWAAQTANEARRRKKAYQAERTAMRESLAPRIAERPEYRALEAVRQVPLDRVALNEAFGQGIVRLLPHKTSVIEGGANPEVVADMLGFENAAQMIEAFRTAKEKPQEVALKEAVEAEMQHRHKDLRDPVVLAEEARQALDYSAVFSETQKILRRLAGEQAESAARRSVAQEGAGKAGHRTQAVNDAEGAGQGAQGAGEAMAAAGESVVAEAERKAAAQERAVSGAAKAQVEGINRVIRQMDGPMIKEAARRMIAGTPLSKMQRDGKWSATLVAHRHRLAAQTAGRKAMVAAAARDWATVQAELAKQYMALALESEARLAAAEVKKTLAGFKGFDEPDKALAKGTDIDFINAGRVILARFSLGRKGAEIDQAAWLEKLAEQDPVQAQEFKGMIDGLTASAKPWQELTVQELRDLSAGLDALREMGRRAKAMEIEGKKVEFAAITNTVREQLDQSGMLADTPDGVPLTTDADRARLGLATVRAGLTRVISWASAKDNGDINGAFQRFMVRPVEAAIGRYRDARRDLMSRLESTLKPIAEDLKNITPVYVDALGSAAGKPMAITRGEAFTLLLNMGNKGNLAKLVAGYRWGQVMENGEVDAGRLIAAMHELAQKGVIDQRHLRAAEGVFALFEEIKPASQKAHKAIHGYEFEEIKPQDIDIPGLGRMKGGYYPVFYDRDDAANTNAFAHDAADQMSAMGQVMGVVGVGSRAGFTKARNSYTGPLNLDASRMLGQFDAILRFSHIEPTARDVYRLIKRREMRDVLGRLDPKAADGILTPWLAASVRQTVGVRTNSPVDHVVRVLSRRSGLLAMAGNVVNTAQQVTGLMTASLHVKWGALAHGVGAIVRDQKGTTVFITEASAFMRARLDTKGQEVHAELDDMLKPKKLIGWKESKAEDFFIRHGYILQSAVQFQMDKVVWLARYNQSIEAGESEADAVHRADLLVKESQGSFAPEDVSAAEHGGESAKSGGPFSSFIPISMGNLIIWGRM